MPIQFITPSIISSVANTQVTGTITASQIATVNANTITSGSIPLAQIPQLTGVKLPTGSVLQVVQVQKTNGFSTGSQSFVDITDLSASITPISASNKILVCISINVSSSQHSDIRLVRNSTAIAIGDASSNQTRSTFHIYSGVNSSGMGYHTFSSSMMWLDSPATTSSVTYKVQAANPYSGGYATYVNRTYQDDDYSYNGRTPSTITLMEIAV